FVWAATPCSVLVELGDVPADSWQGYERVCLEEGVSEVVRSGDDQLAFETLGFEFAIANGWTRTRAEAWLAEHLQVHDLGRTTYLGRLHRWHPPLASFLACSLFQQSASMLPAPEEVVRFQSVPASADRGRDARSAPRGGAGFETDLAQSAGTERLPPDL